MVELALATPSNRPDGPGVEPAGDATSTLVVEKRGNHSAFCKWNIGSFAQAKQKTLWSKYFECGGYDCRLLVYPTGDSQALPGYMSVYIQISDPGNNNSKWDCFASYRLSVRNLVDDNKSVHRDSWHRFSAKKKSHGWCDFAALTSVLDAKQGFLGLGDTIQISTDITILHESVSFSRESDLSGAAPSSTGDVYSGKFVWRVHNFSAFQPLLKTQKIMSPGFPAGDCLLRLSVYQSTVSSTDYLSVCLESKDTDKTGPSERSCWCLFRLAVTSQVDTGKQVHKDSYGRFAADSKAGDNTSLGWNDFMRMSEFLAPEGAYLVNDTAVFSTTFHVIREYTSITRNLEARAAQSAGQMARYKDKRKLVARESDFAGKFTWRIEHFTRLKDLLKKRKITGLCIKSKRFTIGGRDCRLIVYPRGQSQPPTYLSMFLEVCDPRAPSPDWTCFVSHRLAVVNQKSEADKSVSKESQNRYSKSAKDWGWREFVSLTTLFDADAGFLVNDAVVFAAEVLVLRESSDVRHLPLLPSEAATTGQGPPGGAAAALPPPPLPAAAAGSLEGNEAAVVMGRPPSAGGEAPQGAAAAAGGNGAMVVAAGSGASGSSGGGSESERVKTVFTWRIENFQAFKDIMETRKIFSRFFAVGPCELRIGLYESFESLCLYLESDVAASPPSQQAGPAVDAVTDKPPNYWVRYRMAVLNQRHPERTEWKEAAICTRSWNNSVLQFMRVPVGEGDAGGYVLRDSLAITCEVLECCPWLDFAEGELGSSAAEGPPSIPAASAAAAADKRRALSLSDGADTEVDEDEGDEVFTEDCESDVGDDENDDNDSELNMGDEEDALSGWLASAGVQLAPAGDAAPPAIPDPVLVRRALAATLLHQPGAVPMFVASLRMYMDTLAKVKSLLMPSGASAVESRGPSSSDAHPPGESPAAPAAEGAEASPAAGGPSAPGEEPAPAAAGASGSSLMHVLMGLPQLQQALLGMLLDVMLDHCLTARMHKHQLRKQQHQQQQQQERQQQHHAPEAGGVAARGPGGAHSLASPPDSVDSHLGPAAGDGGASSGYVTSEESSYEDAYEEAGPGEVATAAAGLWADDVLQAASARAAAAAGGPSQQQPHQAQRMPNGVLRGLTPLPPRRQQQQQGAGSGNAAPAASSAGQAADLAGAPTAGEQVAAEAARHDEPGGAAEAITDPEDDDDGSAYEGGVCPSVREVEQVVALILGWLRGLDPALLQPLPAKHAAGVGGGGGAGAVMRAPLSSLQKMSMLLADAPRTLQPDIIMLVPRLVDPSEHTAAAGTLLGRLAEASREGADAEAELRMPVLAALGMLHIDPAVADKVLYAALEALPCLSESELPPAVGLVLKLASESDVAQSLAVRVVRQRVRAAAGASAAGTLDAIRLAVLQHRDVARAMLADIEADAREALALGGGAPVSGGAPAVDPPAASDTEPSVPAPTPAIGRRQRSLEAGRRRRRSSSSHSTGSGGAAAEPLPMQHQQQPGEPGWPPGSAAAAAASATLATPPQELQLQPCDMEVLLDLLSLPDVQREAAHVAALCASAGILPEASMAALVERRRLQQLVASSLRPPSPPPAATVRSRSAPASPARSGATSQTAAALDTVSSRQQQGGAAAPTPSSGSSFGSYGGPLSSVLRREEHDSQGGAHVPPLAGPPGSALLLSALSLLDGQAGGVGRAGPLGPSASPQHLPLPPSLAAALPPQQPAQHQQSPQAAASVATPSGAAASLQPLRPSTTAAVAADEFGGLVQLVDSLQQSGSERCRALALGLYRTLFRLYCDDSARRRLLRGLVHSTLGYSAAAAQQQLQQAQQTPFPGPIPGSAPLSRSASGSIAGSRPGSAAGFSSATSLAAAAARSASEELLATLLAEQPGAARIVAGLAMEAARATSQQAEQLLRQLQSREAAAGKELALAREEAARQSASRSRYMERAAELDTQLTRLKAEHRAELAGLASDKKELQTQIRHLETQLEWVRNERDEERSSKSREGREAAQRATEAEAQLTRIKAQRREEQKRWQKEKGALADRAKELEERASKAEQEASRLRSEASTTAQRGDKAAAELRRRLDAAEKSLAERDAELGRTRSAASETEAKLRAHQDALRKLERRLGEEVGRSAAVLHGAGLEALGAEDLEALARVHDQGLKRANALLAKRGRAPVGPAQPAEQPLGRSASPAITPGAATPVPSAAASPIDASKAAYRSGSVGAHSHGHTHHQHQHQHSGGPGHHQGGHHQGAPQHGTAAAALRAATAPPSPAPLPPSIAPSAAASLHAQLQQLGVAAAAAGGSSGGSTNNSTVARPLSLNSSLDSLQSLAGSVGSASSLFSGPWGSVHSMSALQQAAAAAASSNAAAAVAAGRRSAAGQQNAAHAEPAASAAMDAANMERLMGLLPSDLLHS